jgi:hypothetical protein
MTLRLLVITVASAVTALNSTDASRVTVSGKVTDKAGRPLEHATVLIHHAGVRKGYSTFCPSCYADCGKRAVTGPDGSFVIKGLDPDLLFELLAVRDGFQPLFLKKVDPLGQVRPIAVLLSRDAPTNPDHIVRAGG